MKKFRFYFPELVILLMVISCNKDDEILPPQNPQGVTAVSGEAQIIISWNDVNGATGYNIYFSETSGVSPDNGTLISNVVSPYTHSGLTFGNTYYYIVVAENQAGEGNTSSEVSATIHPLTPQNVSASPGEGEATISWDNVSGATAYNLYWGQTTGVTTTNGTLISNTTSPYTHTGLTLGSTYYYIVAASNTGGESDPSSEVNVTIRPSPPANLSVDIGNDQVTIAWDDVSGATTYNIYWSQSEGVTIANGMLISNVTNPYTHVGLTFGSNYYYVITASNDTGESDLSEEINAVPGCIDVPSEIVSWWPGDGDGTDIVGDNDGTLQGSVSFAGGKVGQAFNFSTNQDNVAAGVSGISDLQQLTIEAWVQHRTLINKIERYITIAGNEKAVLRHDGVSGPGQLHFYMNIGGTLFHVRSDNALQVGIWHHVAGTYDGSIMRLYLDGLEVGNFAKSGTVVDGSAVEVGAANPNENIDGLIDEMSIYNRALTANEIAAIYNADIAGKCK